MQNNVKRTLFAGAVALITLALLLLCYFLTFDTPLPALDVNDANESDIAVIESNGVSYVGKGFEVSEYTKNVKKGETAKITVSTDTETELEIEVYYASGKSTSDVFRSKTATKNQDAIWTWTVSSNTTTSKIRVVVRSGDTYATLFIDVI